MNDSEILSFPLLLQSIRKKSGLNQKQLAEKLEVSTVLITKLEIGQKEPSKKFLNTLAKKLGLNTFVIMPFLNMSEINNIEELSNIEKKIYKIGSSLQKNLIEKRAKLLVD